MSLENEIEVVAEIADTIDSLASALKLPLQSALHVSVMQGQLPEIRDRLRAAYIALGGDDLWATHP